jgi:uncharacterized protein YbaP (TraB family)
MQFTESDIEELTKKYRERLKKSANELGSNAPELSQIQEWMAKNMIESPDVLELTLKKIGTGEKVEKKMSSVRGKTKKPRTA